MLTGAISKTAIAVLLSFCCVWHPHGGDYKCFMDYRSITDTTSPQWALQESAWTDETGLRRVGQDYCIALGSAYGTEIGTRYIITLDTGEQFSAILADQKADQDTVDGHTRDTNGAVVEFIVQTEDLPQEVRQMGDVSEIRSFTGEVDEIIKIGGTDGDNSFKE